MSYGGFLLGHPLFWALLTGLPLGAALAAATSRPAHAQRPGRAATRKWTITWLCLSVAVAAAAAGVIVPAELAILALPSLWALGAGLLVTGLGLRFPRSAGLPVLVVVGVAAVLGGWMVRGFLPVRTETELARFTVLAVRDEALSIELVMKTPGSLVPQIVELDGGLLAAELDQLDVPQAFFLLGALRFVHYVGPAAPAGSERTERASGHASPVSPVLERALDRDLVRLRRVTAEATGVNLLRTYRLLVDPSDSPRFVVR